MPYTSLIVSILALVAAATFPPLNLQPVILLVFAPLFFLTRRSHSVKQALGNGLLFGTLYMACDHFWMMSLQAFAPLWAIVATWALYSLYLGLFFAIPLAILRWFPDRFPTWIIAPPLWTLFEFIRSLGPIGNPAGDVGYAVLNLHPLPQIGALGGIFLVSYLVILINALLTDVALKSWAGKLITCFLIFIFAGVWMASGQLIRYHTMRNAPNETAKIVLIQGNHPQMDKFNPILWTRIKQDYLSLTANSPTADLTVWPETITPTLNDDDPVLATQIRRIATQHNSAVLWGTPIRKDHQFYNAIVGVTRTGITLEPYLKNQLMPFGEYWPCRTLLTHIGLGKTIGTDYSLGQTTKPFVLSDTLKIGTVICLESLYPDHLREATKQGASVLVVVANNAWFIHSSAAETHLQMSRMRAIENGRWLCLASNTGYTAFIDPLGNRTQSLPQDQQGNLVGWVTINQYKTPYTQYGNGIISLSIVILTVCGAMAFYRRKA